MELLTGDTLRTVLARQGRIPARYLFEIMEPVVRTMNAMHGAGIIHRDISPDNIMLLNNGQMKLLDFGCARDVDQEQPRPYSCGVFDVFDACCRAFYQVFPYDEDIIRGPSCPQDLQCDVDGRTDIRPPG